MVRLHLMNNIFKNILIGLAAIRANLTRVILTSLGLTIGIFTVSIVTAGVSSIDREFDKSMEYYGNDKVYVGTWPWSFDFDWWKYRNRPKVKENSLDYISQYSEYITAASIKKNTWTRASFGNKSSWLQLNGVYPEYQDMLSGTKVVNGRFFSQNEWDLQRRVIIVGGTVRDGFFDGKDPIGKKIRLNNVTFEIIGELKKQGMGMVPGGTLDNLVIMPSTTFKIDAFKLGNQPGYSPENSTEKPANSKEDCMAFAKSHLLVSDEERVKQSTLISSSFTVILAILLEVSTKPSTSGLIL